MHPEIIIDENGITTLTADDTCPTCGAVINAATGVSENAIPQEGDISLCFACAALLEYGKDLKVKLLSEETQKELSDDVLDDISRTQAFIKSRIKNYH